LVVGYHLDRDRVDFGVLKLLADFRRVRFGHIVGDNRDGFYRFGWWFYMLAGNSLGLLGVLRHIDPLGWNICAFGKETVLFLRGLYSPSFFRKKSTLQGESAGEH
jgi:hypothetical protein